MEEKDRRAAQFMPFDALKGFREALRRVEKINLDKSILSEDLFSYLNEVMNNINIGDFIKIEYYSNFDYLECSGKLKKIDKINKKLYLLNTIINMDDIVNIEKI